MKKTLSVLCAACALILTVSCSKYAPASLKASPTELIWEWDDVTPQTVTVTASKFWTATVSEEAYWTLTPARDGKSLTIAPKADNTGIGMDVTAIVTIATEELEVTVRLTHKGGPFVNGHEYVDLGLSVKWATCNLGADKPEEYGDYFGFGSGPYEDGRDVGIPYYFELLGATDYQSATPSYYGTDKDPMKDYTLGGSHYSEASSEAGKADGIGGSKWDSASNAWMGEWRMPTNAEFKELKEKCNWTWVENNNGVSGYTVTSKVPGFEGKSIFLPAAGYRDGTELKDAGKHGLYWTSSFYSSSKEFAYSLLFSSSTHDWTQGGRCYGESVRPVTK